MQTHTETHTHTHAKPNNVKIEIPANISSSGHSTVIVRMTHMLIDCGYQIKQVHINTHAHGISHAAIAYTSLP